MTRKMEFRLGRLFQSSVISLVSGSNQVAGFACVASPCRDHVSNPVQSQGKMRYHLSDGASCCVMRRHVYGMNETSQDLTSLVLI